MSAPPRVVVLSAGPGAAGDGVADELAAGLRRLGLTAERYVLAGDPPWTAAAESAPAESAPAESAPVEAAVARAVGPHAAAVVSVSPLSSHVAGRLRARGTITAPVVAYLTGAAVPPVAVAPGVDVHLAGTAETARQARALGAADVRVIAPPVDAAFAAPSHRSPAGLPPGRLALIVPASGAGPATGAAVLEAALATSRDVAATGLATPVVDGGDDELFARRITRSSAGVWLGRAGDRAGLLRSCDVVLQNGGGQVTFEALTAGVPVISYRCVPGPDRAGAAALQQAGLAPWIRPPRDLGDALRRVLDLPVPRVDTAGPDAATVIAGLAGVAPEPVPLPIRRIRARPADRAAAVSLQHTVG